MITKSKIIEILSKRFNSSRLGNIDVYVNRCNGNHNTCLNGPDCFACIILHCPFQDSTHFDLEGCVSCDYFYKRTLKSTIFQKAIIRFPDKGARLALILETARFEGGKHSHDDKARSD